MSGNNFNATMENIGEGWNGLEREVIGRWNRIVAPRLVEIRESEIDGSDDAWKAQHAHELAWKTFCEFDGDVDDKAEAALKAITA